MSREDFVRILESKGWGELIEYGEPSGGTHMTTAEIVSRGTTWLSKGWEYSALFEEENKIIIRSKDHNRGFVGSYSQGVEYLNSLQP